MARSFDQNAQFKQVKPRLDQQVQPQVAAPRELDWTNTVGYANPTEQFASAMDTARHDARWRQGHMLTGSQQDRLIDEGTELGRLQTQATAFEKAGLASGESAPAASTDQDANPSLPPILSADNDAQPLYFRPSKRASSSNLFGFSEPYMPKYAQGGQVRGPSGLDRVPILATEGEYMLPVDTTQAIGKRTLDRLVDATHTPVKGTPRGGYANGEMVSAQRRVQLLDPRTAVAIDPAAYVQQDRQRPDFAAQIPLVGLPDPDRAAAIQVREAQKGGPVNWQVMHERAKSGEGISASDVAKSMATSAASIAPSAAPLATLPITTPGQPAVATQSAPLSGEPTVSPPPAQGQNATGRGTILQVTPAQRGTVGEAVLTNQGLSETEKALGAGREPRTPLPASRMRNSLGIMPEAFDLKEGGSFNVMPAAAMARPSMLTRAPGTNATPAERTRWIQLAERATMTPEEQLAAARQQRIDEAANYTQRWLALPEKDRGRMPDLVADTLGEPRRQWGSQALKPQERGDVLSAKDAAALTMQAQKLGLDAQENQRQAARDEMWDTNQQARQSHEDRKIRNEEMAAVKSNLVLPPLLGDFGLAEIDRLAARYRDLDPAELQALVLETLKPSGPNDEVLSVLTEGGTRWFDKTTNERQVADAREVWRQRLNTLITRRLQQ